jgi:hypothetical protein
MAGGKVQPLLGLRHHEVRQAICSSSVMNAAVPDFMM